MGAHRKPVDETIYGEILHELQKYAKKHNCIPNGHAFHKNVLTKECGYEIKYSTFRDHWSTMEKRGHIAMDEATGSWIIKDLLVIDPQETPLLKLEAP